LTDRYTADILRERFERVKQRAKEDIECNARTLLPIRHTNPPEDITENIVKCILRTKGTDTSVVWCKGIGRKRSGDLWSADAGILEVKAFTSVGPSSFGPRKVFDRIYFLDMQGWLEDRLVLWEVKLSNTSPEWKGIKMNKTDTHETQAEDA
jgi:hypothetical protein